MTLLRIGDILRMGSYKAYKETESLIEDIFINAINYRMKPEVKIIPQYNAEVRGMRFRLDFVFEYGSERIGVECDGKEFHNKARDLWRDSILLGEKKLDVIYRFYGTDIYNRIFECVYLIYFHHKNFFPDDEGKAIILAVSEDFASNQNEFMKEEMQIFIDFYNEAKIKFQKTFYATRRTAGTRKAKAIYEAIGDLTAPSIEELAQKVKSKL